MFALLKVDKILASALPIGKYPLLSVTKVTVIVRISWLVSFSVSILVNSFYPCSYEPAVVLCIPVLPIGFFITLFSCFCVLFVVIVIGFVCCILYLKKKQAQIHNTEASVSRIDYKALEKNAITTFLITMSHILLYIPTMLVVGLHGWILPPGAILFCDLFVYSEFLIHPVLLLISSTKMRKEIVNGSKVLTLEHLRYTYQEIGWCIKIHPKEKITGKEKQNQDILSPTSDTWTITDNAIPVITNSGSEDKMEEELGGMPISVSMYGGARDSMRSEYVAVASRSPSTDSSHSQVNIEYSGDSEAEDMPKIITTKADELKIPKGAAKRKVALTCSWPSLAGQVSVNTPSIGSAHTEGSEPSNNKRLSTNCDSGYSELDICSVVQENKYGVPRVGENFKDFSMETKLPRPTSVFLQKQQIRNQREISGSIMAFSSCVKPVLEDLELCFQLEKIVETTDEDRYLEEIEDVSICSDYSYSSDRKSYPAQVPKQSSQESSEGQHLPRQFSPGSDQFDSLQTIANIATHNVSKKYAERLHQEKLDSLSPEKGNSILCKIEAPKLVPLQKKLPYTKFIKSDSFKSLPLSPLKKAVLPELKGLSLPKVIAPTGRHSEHSPRSREIFI